MNIIEILTSEFDFKKEDGICFAHYCLSSSNKSVNLKEVDMMKQTDKELAHIEVCKDHLSIIDSVTERLNKEFYGDFKIVKSDVRDRLK